MRRRVALKLIKAGMDSKNVLARFDAERQALAVMDHPNIAKVLDGGLTELGRPFFAMEYVNGNMAVYRFTALTSDSYQLDLSFTGNEATRHGGTNEPLTSSDVYLLVNGVVVWDGYVNSAWNHITHMPGAGPSLSTVLTLNAGDTVDFAAGAGIGNDASFDTIGISARFVTGAVAVVPEQNALLFFGIAGMLVCGAKHFRTKWRRQAAQSDATFPRQR